MKRYEDSDYFEKRKLQEWKREHKAGGFRCAHCRQFVVINDYMGTNNRNHCNVCLWSKHVDAEKGDRRSNCNGGMEPIGLTFKHEGFGRVGEIMFIHHCLLCSKIHINRTARDDPEDGVLNVFDKSLGMLTQLKLRLDATGIFLLCEEDRNELQIQLYGTVR